MKSTLRIWLVVGIGCALLAGTGRPAGAADDANTSQLLPPVPKSPVETFRELLTMSPAEREKILTNRPPAARVQLERKLAEYGNMPLPQREARLNATQFYWYLEQFISSPATNREAQLASVPAPFHDQVLRRLGEFDLLPPELQKEALTNESTREYFLGRSATAFAPPPPAPPVVPPPPLPLPVALSNLSGLDPRQRQNMFAGFEHFFELPPPDRARVLSMIPQAQRASIQRTLRDLEQLPREQRDQGLKAIDRFVSMSDAERQVFLRNTARWKQLPPAEQQVWMKISGRLPPLVPYELIPPPPGLMPSRPRPNSAAASNLATNAN